MTSDQQSNNSSDKPVALVTGAGKRVGNAIARSLGAAGYRLILHASRSLADAQKTADELVAGGTAATAVVADLRDEHATRQMVDQAHGHFGRMDALVNCAAVWISKPLEQVTADDVRRHFEINTLGTFICCQHVGLIMVAQEQGGAIVNFGDWAIERPYLNYAAYFPSKGSIPTLTRTMAVELGSRNPRVRVNAIMPGPVLLPEGLSSDEQQAIVRNTLAKRSGTPGDVAQAVLLLLQDSFITGVCLEVDGGRHVYSPFE